MNRILAAFVFCSIVYAPSSYASSTFVVSAGNNVGNDGDFPLRFAEEDAIQFATVMRNLGDVDPENSILVQGASASGLRKTILDTNRRIRRAISRGNDDTSLIVFYSGHADNSGLHMRGSNLSFTELEDLVEASPAKVRVLILDSCRSGGVTRVKGANPAETFKISARNKVEAEGLAVITSSSAWEDSHESDRLRGSFFSHHLLSGLRGAADHNRDATVTLNEVYSYAYQQTLRSSGQTQSLQHPTYRYDIKGKGDLALTQLAEVTAGSARLQIQEAGLYLLMDSSEAGTILNEVMVQEKGATLHLKPGRYFIQKRARDHFLEYAVSLHAHASQSLENIPRKRIDYAKLVRKGAAQNIFQHSVFVMTGLRSAVLEGYPLGVNLILGYNIDFPMVSVGARARFSRNSSNDESTALDGTTSELGIGLTLQKFFDLYDLSLGIGVTSELNWYHQVFSTTGSAPTRNSWAAGFGPLASIEADIFGPLILKLEAAPMIYVHKQAVVTAGATQGSQLRTQVTTWVALGAGWRF